MKSPVSTGLVVLTLGLTIGLFGAVVAVIDETFWRPLRVGNGDRLLTLYNARAAAPQFQTLSYPDYVTVRDAAQRRVDVAAFVRVCQTFGGDSFLASGLLGGWLYGVAARDAFVFTVVPLVVFAV
jgi:hypothetical protein